MTNEMIIMVEKEKLAKEGILKYTGRVLKGINTAGEEIEFPEVEPIHTCKTWNEMGYKIKKGTNCNIKFKVWKYDKRKKKDEEENSEEVMETAKGRFYLKTACWYTIDQVEKIPERA